MKFTVPGRYEPPYPDADRTAFDPASVPERYGRLRVRIDDLSAADRLARDAVPYGPGSDFGTVTAVCAPGFAAYARILHPAALDERPVTWATAAAAYGRTVTGTTTWGELIGCADPVDYLNGDASLPGVWDEHPAEGPTPPDVARALLPVLARHTTTPDRCWYGLWDGYGTFTWPPGTPTFPTPGRDEILLSGRLTDAPTPGDDPHHFLELPDLWWPADHAWCLGGDVDLLSTYIGGTPALITALLATPGLEAHRVEATSPVN
ncbi:hypothetical protein [Streptomyces sp. NPDC060194]|uniref:hypothetical protein n=1 Tax=Streptomyces sp. NPDC060194 TaxID=3347069 RepID=UPI003648D18D